LIRLAQSVPSTIAGFSDSSSTLQLDERTDATFTSAK